MKKMSKKTISGDYFRLFVRREGKVVLGRRFSNMWLLTGVLALTFLAIAFSNASLNYLSFKMNDPFINWLNIENTSDKSDYYGLTAALEDSAFLHKYHIVGYQEDYKFSYNFFTRQKSLRYFTGRFFQELNTPLIDAILSNDNVVRGQRVESVEEIDPQSIGVIMTEEMLLSLGYDNAPAYIGYARYSPDADTLGFRLYVEDYAEVPVPVLGIVRKLPGNVDFISSSFFLEQDFNDYSNPFYMTNPEYASSLHYFVPEGMDEDAFVEEVMEVAGAEGIDLMADAQSFYLPQIEPFKAGGFISFYPNDNTGLRVLQEVGDEIASRYPSEDVVRVFDFDFSDSYVSQISFVSVHFEDLDMIKDFENFVKEEFYIEIEMSQINAKENFNAVSVMANILSWAIVIFSILCIVLFIVNLLQSYFQKVKKNLGTFKAFGISNTELISVYILIMSVMVVAATLLSFTAVFIVQLILPLLGIVRDGSFSYLSIWSMKTLYAVIIVWISSMVTVYQVMGKLLSATPGDLIYDRQ
ncbi:MAG TPA: hypothetical protein IAC03_03415 [Candidatus Coprenecus pullistercoris]|nr:hypothetical protein [Candidatus Coprenecus pullistercoris]